ncbi:hypothetical protein Z280_01902 [Streptococcus pyogenes ABC020057168]|nr:hypothetical protein Z280_01902 [Streptococcus pyogenes ABC020057168]
MLTNWPNSSLFNTNVVGNVVSLFLDFKKALISMILRGNLILYQKRTLIWYHLLSLPNHLINQHFTTLHYLVNYTDFKNNVVNNVVILRWGASDFGTWKSLFYLSNSTTTSSTISSATTSDGLTFSPGNT